MNISGVYLIKNNLNESFYGGSSCNIKKRWNGHLRLATNGSNKCPKLYSAMRKYGIENFSIEIITECNPEQLFEKEQEWLDANIDNPKCYNVSRYADNPTRGRSLSDEHKNNLRKPKNIVNPRKTGYNLSHTHKKSISESLKGIRKTEEHKKNISSSVRGKSKKYPNGRFGENNPHSKLTYAQVNEIKQLFNPDIGKYKMYNILAEKYEVSWGTIRNIIVGATYAN